MMIYMNNQHGKTIQEYSYKSIVIFRVVSITYIIHIQHKMTTTVLIYSGYTPEVNSMKKNEEPTQSVKKSVRFPKDVAAELEKIAQKNFGGNFSNATVYRIKHFSAPLTPAIMSKIQDIANTAIETVRESAPDKASDIERKVDFLWKYLK